MPPISPASHRIGLVGVGLMGHGIAKNLLAKGWTLSFLAHPGNQPSDDLSAAGATSCDDLASLSKASEVILLCVTGAAQVDEVMNGSGDASGLRDAMRAGQTLIDCSTSLPELSQKLAKTLASAQIGWLDGPMTRTPKEAEAGRLNLIVGGDAAVFKAHLPLLEAFAENIHYVGLAGQGHTLKLLHNYVSLGFSAVLADAVAHARKAGVADEVLLDVLGKGGGAGVVFDRLQPYIERGDSSGFTFTLANAAKDLRYYTRLIELVPQHRELAEAIAEIYARADEISEAHAAVPTLVEVLAQTKSRR